MYPTIPNGTGWIEVICGGMFSGKTEELIRRLRRARIARQRVQIFKPVIDNRYDADRVVSHSRSEIEATPIGNIEELFDKLEDDTRIVGIDEAQFFTDAIIPIAERLANRGLRVVIAGLDLDYRGIPFGPMPTLLAMAESVTKMSAVCGSCGHSASFSQRRRAEPTALETPDAEGRNPVLVGGEEWYEPRCRRCFDPA